MSTVESSIEVDVPVRDAYNQWTQFEDFPQFMEGVEEVVQIDDATLRWKVELAGAEREFLADIITQEPDERIAWSSREGEEHAGMVTFEPLGPDRTRVTVRMEYEPQVWTEKVADALNLIDMRVKGDLKRFKSFIEERGGHETGAWRGEIKGGQPQDPGFGRGTTP